MWSGPPSLGTCPWNSRSLAPVLTDHTIKALSWLVSGDHVTTKFSHGEKSISLTPPCVSFSSFFHDGPPHNMMPRRWKVARYVPRGDQLMYVSVQLRLAYAGSASCCPLTASFHQISVSSLYRTTYWSRACSSSNQPFRFSDGSYGGGLSSTSSSGIAMYLW